MSKLNQEELLKIVGNLIEEGRRNIRDLKGILDISQDEFDERMYKLNQADNRIRRMIQKPNKDWIEKKIKSLATLFYRFIEIGRENDKVSDDYINTKAKEVVRSFVD